MTSKERLLNAIRGKEIDRIPWSPFLAYFWDFQPQDIKDKGQINFLEGIGADPLLRGFHRLFNIVRKNCAIKEQTEGKEKVTTYETPIGTLREKHILSLQGNTWFLMEHPVKTKEDFKVLTYIFENTEVMPDFKAYNEEYKKYGERILSIPVISTELKTSFQSLLEHWVGTEELIYALLDYPEVVTECINAMKKPSSKSVEISANSVAEGFISWEDTSTTNISPAYFDEYIAPEINEWCDIIHSAGKFYIHHACGHLKAIIGNMGKTKIDVIESISPPPTGNIELWEARKALPHHIALIGGIEPTVFLNSDIREFEQYVINLLGKMGKGSFVIANSDSCPPGVSIDKFNLVRKLVAGHS